MTEPNGDGWKPQPPREGLTDWKKFALLLFALVAIAAVVFVYVQQRGMIDSML